jgi:hypothetical protein
MDSHSSVYFTLYSLTEQTERRTEVSGPNVSRYSMFLTQNLLSLCWLATNIQIHTNIKYNKYNTPPNICYIQRKEHLLYVRYVLQNNTKTELTHGQCSRENQLLKTAEIKPLSV